MSFWDATASFFSPNAWVSGSKTNYRLRPDVITPQQWIDAEDLNALSGSIVAMVSMSAPVLSMASGLSPLAVVFSGSSSSSLLIDAPATASNDLYVSSSAYGVVLMSPGGLKWRITVNASGVLSSTNIP